VTRRRLAGWLGWAGLIAIVLWVFAVAMTSPLLAWRDPIYIAAGLAGIVALACLLVQPLLAGGFLPGLEGLTARRWHRGVGLLCVAAVLAHVAGLWVTSPPDVIDVLLLRSPTPFSLWGVIAMWALFATAALAALRRRLWLRWRVWRAAHAALALVIVGGSVGHALLIEGTMGDLSKWALCGLVVVATVALMVDLKVWRLRRV
jgi:hypothetical protein